MWQRCSLGLLAPMCDEGGGGGSEAAEVEDQGGGGTGDGVTGDGDNASSSGGDTTDDGDEDLHEWPIVTLEVDGEQVNYYLVEVVDDLVNGLSVAVLIHVETYNATPSEFEWTFRAHSVSAEEDDVEFLVINDPDGTIDAAVDAWLDQYFSEDEESELIRFTDEDGDEHVSLGVFTFEDGTWLAACDEDDVDNEPEDRLYYFFRVAEDGTLTYDENLDVPLTDTYTLALEDGTVTLVTFDDGKVVFPTNDETAVADEQDETAEASTDGDDEPE